MLIVISCAKSYESISFDEFKNSLENKNIDRIVFADRGLVLVEFEESDELFQIENDSIPVKKWNQFIRDFVNNYSGDEIIFESR